MRYLCSKLYFLFTSTCFVIGVTLNTLCVLPVILCFAFFKSLPVNQLKLMSQKVLNGVCVYWVNLNNFFLARLTKVEKHYSNSDLDLGIDKSYLVISNHQSWLDILILQFLLHRKVPALKFFLKDSLIWVPILGLCWWGLGFPFMKRYSKAYLKKHPEKEGQDLIATKKACEQFKVTPVGIMNYPEGTRLTPAKHKKQGSTFKHLLKPKAGGLGFALPILGEMVDSMIDLTIVYPNDKTTLLSFLWGDIPKIKVHLRQIQIPQKFYTMNYQKDEILRKEFQQWLNERWQEKDKIISNL